jgi:hypothetical protein
VDYVTHVYKKLTLQQYEPQQTPSIFSSMPPVYLPISYGANGHRGIEYKAVDETLCPNTSTYIEDNNDYIYNDVRVKHPTTDKD